MLAFETGSAAETLALGEALGAVLGKRAALVYGNRETSTNLRYKYGTNLVSDDRM